MKLIGFTGLRGSGKDTAAAAFIDEGWAPIKMAQPLKDMLRALLAYQGLDAGQIYEMLEGTEKEMQTRFLAGRSPRHAMQSIGTEWGRCLMADDIWIRVAAERCRQFGAAVISDIRFQNEIAMVRSLGGKVYRIERGHAPPDLHVSEAMIPDLDVDGVIANHFRTAAEFRRHVADRFLGAKAFLSGNARSS